MPTFRFLCLIGITSLLVSTGSGWAQVDADEPDSQLEEPDSQLEENEAETSTDCVENKTCQKVQSEDEKLKTKQDPTEVEEENPTQKADPS